MNTNEVILTTTNPISYPCPHLIMKSICNLTISPLLAPSISEVPMGDWHTQAGLRTTVTLKQLPWLFFPALPQGMSCAQFASWQYLRRPLPDGLYPQGMPMSAKVLSSPGPQRHYSSSCKMLPSKQRRKIFPALPCCHALYPFRPVQSAQAPQSNVYSRK